MSGEHFIWVKMSHGQFLGGQIVKAPAQIIQTGYQTPMNNFRLKYLGESETEFGNIFWHESGTHIHENSKGRKSRSTVNVD